MKYLFDEWWKIKKTLTGKNIFLFLDYDGTLSSIADHPDKAVISDEIKNTLQKVIRNPRFQVAVISGRRLKDIKSRVGIKEIIYAGNHGLEIEGPVFKYQTDIIASYKILVAKIKKELHQALANFKGILREAKKLTLSIHYRLADKKLISNIIEAFDKTIAGYLNAGKIKVRTGTMIVEIIPPVKWDKGSAVLWILNRPEFAEKNFCPIYFGDDITDEDAFRALQDRGVTVLVGHRKKTYAQYYLNDVTEVGKFAEQL